MNHAPTPGPVKSRMQAAGSHRLFFALVPDLRTRREIESIHRELSAQHGIRGRPVKPGQYHVTLVFLGNQPTERLPLLLSMAAGLVMPPCEVVLNQIGSFRRAGVGWFGVSKPPRELCDFQERLVAELERANVAFDRKPWTFHLTLYRDLRTPVFNIDPGAVSWRLDGYSLVESVSIEHGVEYRQLGRWKAGSSGNVSRNA